MGRVITILMLLCCYSATAQYRQATEPTPPIENFSWWEKTPTDSVFTYFDGVWSYSYSVDSEVSATAENVVLSESMRNIFASSDTIYLPTVDAVTLGQKFEVIAADGTTALNPVRVVSSEAGKINNANSVTLTSAFQTVVFRLVKKLDGSKMYIITNEKN